MDCSRAVGVTEQSWCRAVPGGTGITVIGLLLSNPPDIQILQNALHKLQNSHPILRSKLHLDPRTRKFSFLTPTVSDLQLKLFDLRSTLSIINLTTESLSPFHIIIEHDLNLNPWENASDGSHLFEAKLYEIEEGGRSALVLKAHTAVCDKTAAETVVREVVRVLRGVELENGGKREVKMGIEDYMPGGKGKKSLWARGVNMLGYSLSAFRLSNIEFVDTRSPRRTHMESLRLEPEVTARLVEECRKREMKVCGAVTAAALMAARSSKAAPQGQWEKYCVGTLVDCRSLLLPPLNSHDVGFYHSGIVNMHNINGREELWDLAEKAYKSFKVGKSTNKHFSDIADLTFLMCRAIDNPGLTPSSSLRTSYLSVFEDIPSHDKFDYKGDGVLEDYVAISSIHGAGPTLALFGAIRDGRFDFKCVYPTPLHSRHQIRTLLARINTLLTDSSSTISLL